MQHTPTLKGGLASRPTPASERRSLLHRARMAFRRWRRTRPFWGGLWAILGGLIVMAGPLSAFKVILVAGQVVWIGITVGVLIWVFGLFLWFSPSQRQVAGVLIIIASLVSFVSSDFGGFLVGMLLGLLGGSMGFSWVPDRHPKRRAAKETASAGP